jgi:hypothetical protein
MTALGFTLVPGNALSQQNLLREQLIGAWRLLIDDTVRPDGSKNPNFGPNPNGIVIFDASGHYALELSRSNNPKFAANNRAQGTAEENKAVVSGAVAHFGTYAVDEADKTLTFHIESSSFPNLEGALQKRQITLTGDDLKWVNPQAAGGGTAEVYWRRIK